MPEPKIEDFGENLKWKIDHFPPKMGVPKRGEAVYPILQKGYFFLKDGRFLLNIQASKRQAKFEVRPSFAAFSHATAHSEHY